MDNLRSERDKTLVALRDLEMGNDELERNERSVSLAWPAVPSGAADSVQSRGLVPSRSREQVQQGHRGEDTARAGDCLARRAGSGDAETAGRD